MRSEGGKRRGAGYASPFALVFVFAALSTVGCRVNQDDIHRWETTAHGPDKLQAVLIHDKYELPLRVDAVMSLVRMKPRGGRHVGIGVLVDGLTAVAPEPRQAIMAGVVPLLIAELQKPPPVAQAGQPSPPDGSYPYKDAAYALLTTDKTPLITDEALAKSLKQALVAWAMADFEHRLDNRTQTYGMEQLLRFIGAESVTGMPKLMTRESRRLDQMSTMVAELGSAETKEAASKALVAIASFVISDEWVKVKTPELQAANAASKLQPTEAQFKGQLGQYQDEELFRVFGSMKKVGGRAAVGFALGFAADKNQSEKRRQAALAAIEGRLDRNSDEDVKRILEVASGDAPDGVLDQAFRRIGEMPREKVVDKLYELFKSDKWRVRRAAAGTVLRMSTLKHLDEFMSKLPDGKGFAMPEALTYGALFADLKDGSPKEALAKHLTSGSATARTSAIGYYYTFGSKADLGVLRPLEGDTTRAPTCDGDPECTWSCVIAKPGATKPDETESKNVETIGDFVRYCVEPAMSTREPEKPGGNAPLPKEEKK